MPNDINLAVMLRNEVSEFKKDSFFVGMTKADGFLNLIWVAAK